MKINLKEELGLNKDFEVKASNMNMEKSIQMQLSMAKMDNIQGKEGVEILEQTLKTIQDSSQFVKDMLKMNAKESALIDDMEMTDTMQLVNRICLRVMGNTDEEIKKCLQNWSMVKTREKNSPAERVYNYENQLADLRLVKNRFSLVALRT